MATVKVLNEVVHPEHTKDDWHLALQLAEFSYSSGVVKKGYRFICRRGNDEPKIQPRIPSLADVELLLGMAKAAGWGDQRG